MTLIIPNKKSIVLKGCATDDMKKLFVKHLDIKDKDGNSYLVIPHTEDSLRLLKNIGMTAEISEPIKNYYPFPKLDKKYAPMKHQLDTAAFATIYKRCFIFNSQRTGKTASCIWASDYLLKTKEIDKVLIICTDSNVNAVWKNSLERIVPERSAVALRGSAKRRANLLVETHEYYIINHDGIKISTLSQPNLGTGLSNKGSSLWDKFITPKTLIIVDEATAYGGDSSDRTNLMMKLAKKTQWLWLLTGTPLVSGPSKVWSLAKMVCPNRVPKTYNQWKFMTMIQVAKNIWKPIRGWEKIASQVLQPAIRFSADKLIELPPLQHIHLEVDLSVKQKKCIKLIKDQKKIALTSGDVIKAESAAAELMKIKQILAGVVYGKNKEGQEVSISLEAKPRLQATLDIINECSRKVIVLANFKSVVDEIVTVVSKHFKCVQIDGRITGRTRDNAIQTFMQDESYKVLVAHPKTIAHGLEFSNANTIIWYTPPPSAEDFSQANKRIQSQMQKHKMGIYYLYSSNLEYAINRAYANSENLQTVVLDNYTLYKDFIME